MIGLYNLGLTDEEIKDILEINPEINDLNEEEISNNIQILKNIGCSNKNIKNIIIANPFYLNRTIDDITDLINKLLEIGITNISVLFDTNPFMLNKEVFEIDEYINIELNNKKSIDEIVDELESNPYIIDEN